MTSAREPCDHKGVVKGVSGFKRYRVRTGSDSLSESGSEAELQHFSTKKSRRALGVAPEDARDFMKGDADVADDDTDDLPEYINNNGAAQSSSLPSEDPNPSSAVPSGSESISAQPAAPALHVRLPVEPTLPKFNKADEVARATTTWQGTFMEVAEKPPSAKPCAQDTLANESSVSENATGKKPYSSHFTMLKARRHILSLVIGCRTSDELKLAVTSQNAGVVEGVQDFAPFLSRGVCR